MELYRVLLVDDEEDIRVGISRKMDWASLGFALVGEAENGRDALELAETLEPDLVLTDIKMPFMDGLELCRILSERLPASKFVVFSGFDDFEYAKQAVGLNVSEYILKPINAAELTGVCKSSGRSWMPSGRSGRTWNCCAAGMKRVCRCCGSCFIPGCWRGASLPGRNPRERPGWISTSRVRHGRCRWCTLTAAAGS